MSGRSTGQGADVIVVGAGPGGSATAYHLARSGLDVLLLEKAAFPREKVCGDGLTPRAVGPLTRMGIDVSESAGWLHNKGLRIYGGGMRLHLPWPELAEYPAYGLVRRRDDFDQLLASRAVAAGARLHQHTQVTGPVHDERTGRVVGVRAEVTDAELAGAEEAGPAAGGSRPDDTAAGGPEPVDPGARRPGRGARNGGRGRTEVVYRAPLVVAADGNSSRLAVACGRRRRDDRPMGVAVRTYYTSPRHRDEWLESWLELWHGPARQQTLLPGYGWIFGMGDGTSNVGLGILNTSTSFAATDVRALLRDWTASLPPEWGYAEANRVGPVRGAALPMGFNRQPHYGDGLLLVGDAGGMVNPFNGEGIPYAMESGELAAEVILRSRAQATAAARERTLGGYPRTLKDTLGGYYTLGRLFVKAIGDPRVMRVATRHGLPHPTLMRFTLKLLANLTDPRGGDAMDRVINALCKLAPAA